MSRPFSAAGTAASDSIGAIVARAPAAARGDGEQAGGAVGPAVVARRWRRPRSRSMQLRVAVGLRAQRAGLVPLRDDRQRGRRRRRIVEQLLQGLRRRGVHARSCRLPSVATARTMLALSGAAPRPAPAAATQQWRRRCAGSAAGSDGHDEIGQAPADVRRSTPRPRRRGACSVAAATSADRVQLSVAAAKASSTALRCAGGRRGARLLVQRERLAAHRLLDLREPRVRRVSSPARAATPFP